ncbi:MAG: HxsD-like protein [Clostridia bacterium]|nr:HxsD-like protein [Clostridia bacterium]
MEIKIDKNIYSKESLKKTIQAYEPLVKIDFLEEAGFFIVRIDNINEDIKDIIQDEFCNYLLFESGKCL